MNTLLPPTASHSSDEWYAWREGIRNARCGHPGLDALVDLEQMMLRSHKEKRCAECGDNGTVFHVSGLIKSVDHYFLCDDCDRHFEGSVGGETYTVLKMHDGFEYVVASLSNRRNAERLARINAGRVRRNVNA